jgi:type VI secretion system protein ImpL
VAIDDFGRMFGYGGVLEKFFNENLAQFVDRSGGQWRVKSGSGLNISAAALQQFRHAEQIREAYFAPGAQRPEMRVTIVPNSLDADVSRFVLEVDGQQFDYRHGPQRQWNLRWPGEGIGMARIMFEEASGGRPTVVEEGPWALFRLLDDSTVQATSETQFTVVMGAGGRSVELLVQASSVRNPLARRDLHDFSCSSGL